MQLDHDGRYNIWWSMDGHRLRFVPAGDYVGEEAFLDSFPPNRLEIERWDTGYEVGMCCVVDY